MKRVLIIVVLATMLFSCEAQSQIELINAMVGQQSQGPVLVGVKSIANNKVQLTFDKFIKAERADFNFDNSLIKVESVNTKEQTLTLVLNKAINGGKKEDLKAHVTDLSGNSLTFTIGIWGYNSNLPHLLINEFTTKGSGNNPDRVELIVLEQGDLAGITLYDGVKDDYDSCTILPPFLVKKGDYIVIEFSEELRGAHPIEFFGGEVGLGANNGVITLYDSPEGDIIDAVIYSNLSSTQFGGFGTRKVEERVRVLELTNHWLPKPINNSDCIDSSDSTATRSMCRTLGKGDTNRKADWHIVPTGKSSFGFDNVTDRYTK
jgi:hypothetical protein